MPSRLFLGGVVCRSLRRAKFAGLLTLRRRYDVLLALLTSLGDYNLQKQGQ
jgi:hypothetical protein